MSQSRGRCSVVNAKHERKEQADYKTTLMKITDREKANAYKTDPDIESVLY